MKSHSKYDPEDIESLLLHKQFHELYPEEKEFILQHIETPEEYNSLRKTLFELRDAAQEGEWLEPDASLKKDLMAQFASEEKGGFRIWLNSLFTWPDVQWYRQPALRVAFAGACVAAVAIYFINTNDSNTPTFAENKTEKAGTTEPTAESSDTTTTEKKEDNLFAENIPQKELPPAPAPSAVAISAPRDVKFIEAESAEDLAVADYHAEKEMAESPAPAMTDDMVSYKVEEKAASTNRAKKEADNTNAGNAVTFSAPTVTSNSVTTTKALGNAESINLASTKSKPLSEVNDLLSVLFTAQ